MNKMRLGKFKKCVDCGQPFVSGVNIFTPEGIEETKISGTCEKCFEAYFEDDGYGDDDDDVKEIIFNAI